MQVCLSGKLYVSLEGERGDSAGRTCVGGDISLWYIGTIVLAKVKPFILDHKLAINDNTYDSKPTPKPAITRPTTMTQKPGVKV